MEPVTAPAAPVDAKPFVKRFIGSFLMISLVMIVPLLVIAAAVGITPAMAYPFGAMAGLFATTGDGARVAWRLLPVLVVGAVAAAATTGTWWWVLVLAATGAVVGYLSAQGWAIAIIEVAICTTTADPIHGWKTMLGYAVFCVVGYAAGIFLARLGGAPTDRRATTENLLAPQRAALVGALALAAAGALAVPTNWSKMFWFPMTFLILLEYVVGHDQGGWKMVGYRFVGTLLGVIVLVPIVGSLLGVVQFIAIIASLAAGMAISNDRYWLGAAFITAGVVLFSSSGSDPLEVAHQRWAAIVAAGVILLVTVVALNRWVKIGPRDVTEAARSTLSTDIAA